MSDIEQWEAEGGACPLEDSQEGGVREDRSQEDRSQEDRSREGVRGMIEDLSAYERAMREQDLPIARGGEQEDFGQIYIPVEQMSSEEWGKILGSGPGNVYLMESPVPSVQRMTVYVVWRKTVYAKDPLDVSLDCIYPDEKSARDYVTLRREKHPADEGLREGKSFTWYWFEPVELSSDTNSKEE